MNKLAVLWPLFCMAVSGRQDPQSCGTHALRAREEAFLHRTHKAAARRLVWSLPNQSRDAGQIAILEDSGGVVGRRNPFNLDGRTLTFQPGNAAASVYSFQVDASSYDQGAASSGTPIALNDDDSFELPLPFSFPYFKSEYRSIHINSDGNLTFQQPDSASADRSLGRLLAGPPRIAPLYTDVDPSQSTQGVRVSSDANRVIVSWSAVPAYVASGKGAPQTFQVRLYPTGRIEMAWSGIDLTDAVVGISPGGIQGNAELLSFTAGSSQQFTGAVTERFSGLDAIDIVTAAQRFYETHEDAYDYLVLFNNEAVSAGSGVVAFEVTARNSSTGFGADAVDEGAQYGSARRLQAVLNMGPLTQYPIDPNFTVPARGNVGDTTLSVLGHEAGHLFLAFTSVRDPEDPKAKPMLGRSLAHWSFLFNSEASLLEGNRIQDNGEAASPRFLTTGTVEGYAPLDQYLMGFRAPEEVPPTFLVRNSPSIPDAGRPPQKAQTFDGLRRDVTIQDVIDVSGPRLPDSTVAQRRFRFAFVLIVPAGSQPNAVDLAKLESVRSGFEAAYARFSSNRATADTTLKRAVQLSSAPAAGVLAGATGSGTITLDRPTSGALTILLRSAAGLIGVPPSVTIPEGASGATFAITGVQAGVDTLTAEPADPSHETATAQIQVAAVTTGLTLTAVSGANQAAVPGKPLANPVVFKVTDANRLSYSGVHVQASTAGGGVATVDAVTDAAGLAHFEWTPSTGANELTASINGRTPVKVVALAPPAFSFDTILNAASFVGGISPASIATIFGVNMTGASVLVNGEPAQVLYSDLRQLNFVVPADVTGASASVSIQNVAGSAAAASVPVVAIQPGLFAAVNRGGFAEIYGTGLLGVTTPKVTIGGQNATVLYSGIAPGFPGLYQIDAALPGGTRLPAAVIVTAAGQQSNFVTLR